MREYKAVLDWNL